MVTDIAKSSNDEVQEVVCRSWKSKRSIVGPKNMDAQDADDELSSTPCLMFSNGVFFHPLRDASFQNVIVVDTMRRQKDDFETELRFRAFGNFELSPCCNPVWYRGKYYCMGMDGDLAIYDPTRNKLRQTYSPKALWKHFSASDHRHFMFEGEGDLWAVFAARQGREFPIASVVERAKVRGVGNKIYFPKFRGDQELMFYSLATKRYHTFKGTTYQSFHGSKEMLRSTWIKIDFKPTQTWSEGPSW
ncbi:OLC1v1002577C1 [Oldenlandia corymbosa var. corymbosa]|uniref:OLC1v1002577C1 n=1 Tax=Oldenlandia corymbosa var. corymbosa TaxID=529605 RepID=A0AAV1DBD0_OLDCO|nr:OLC1v1002577C1 [Oldenlandia corymbosa var. corymbosa]